MLEQLLVNSSPFKQFDIDFVSIADRLPSLLVSGNEALASLVDSSSKEPG
jgi:hypothetical protein